MPGRAPGITLPNVHGSKRGELWWDWQKVLIKGSCVVVQLIILPGDSGIGYTCVATNLNALPPSRNTQTWWQKNRSGVFEIVKVSAKTAEKVYPGRITKAFSAMSNSLAAQGKWRKTNWFVYQFLDADPQGCAVEWQINKRVLRQYGPLLRGSLVLAFHGAYRGVGEQKGIRLLLRPQLAFNPKDELRRVTPTHQMKDPEQVPDSEQVALNILPDSTERDAGEPAGCLGL